MLKSLLRGTISVTTTVTDQLEDYKLPSKTWKRLQYTRQLKTLSKIPHDIIIDNVRKDAPVKLLAFISIDNVPVTLLIDGYKSNKTSMSVEKLDLGPDIKPSIYKGTILEVKYDTGVFHVYDVLLFKGETVTNRAETIDLLNAEYLPFLSRPQIFSYTDLVHISMNKLVFLPKNGFKQDVWLYRPESKMR